jgi:hypothetical protein
VPECAASERAIHAARRHRRGIETRRQIRLRTRDLARVVEAEAQAALQELERSRRIARVVEQACRLSMRSTRGCASVTLDPGREQRGHGSQVALLLPVETRVEVEVLAARHEQRDRLRAIGASANVSAKSDRNALSARSSRGGESGHETERRKEHVGSSA